MLQSATFYYFVTANYTRLLGQTWFSCSLYSFHSEQAEQKLSALEHLCWRTPEYSIFQGGADRTVTWPVPKYNGGPLPTLYWDIFQSFPIGSENYSYWKNVVISKRGILSFFYLLLGNQIVLFFHNFQTIIAWFTSEYSKVPSFACFRWLFWRTPRTLKLLNQVRPCLQPCTSGLNKKITRGNYVWILIE